MSSAPSAIVQRSRLRPAAACHLAQSKQELVTVRRKRRADLDHRRCRHLSLVLLVDLRYSAWKAADAAVRSGFSRCAVLCQADGQSGLGISPANFAFRAVIRFRSLDVGRLLDMVPSAQPSPRIADEFTEEYASYRRRRFNSVAWRTPPATVVNNDHAQMTDREVAGKSRRGRKEASMQLR